MKLLKIFKKGRKSIMAMELVFLIIVSIVVLAFMLDVMVLSWKTTILSETISSVTRTVGIQGGASSSIPANYGGGTSGYKTSLEVCQKVKDTMKTGAIGKYSIYVNNNLFTNAEGACVPIQSAGKPYPYQTRLDTRIEMEYKWQFMSYYWNMSHNAIQRRTTTSEYWYVN